MFINPWVDGLGVVSWDIKQKGPRSNYKNIRSWQGWPTLNFFFFPNFVIVVLFTKYCFNLPKYCFFFSTVRVVWSSLRVPLHKFLTVKVWNIICIITPYMHFLQKMKILHALHLFLINLSLYNLSSYMYQLISNYIKIHPVSSNEWHSYKNKDFCHLGQPVFVHREMHKKESCEWGRHMGIKHHVFLGLI